MVQDRHYEWVSHSTGINLLLINYNMECKTIKYHFGHIDFISNLPYE